jgi:hypothetical protein
MVTAIALSTAVIVRGSLVAHPIFGAWQGQQAAIQDPEVKIGKSDNGRSFA